MKVLHVAPLVLLTACTVAPKVQYREIKTPADMLDVNDSFFLQKSVVRIEKAGTAQGKDPSGNAITIADVSITSKPVEDRSRKLGIKAVSNWMQKTSINVVKVPNTDLLSSISVETTDQVAKSINDFGGAIVKVISLTAGVFSVQSCKFPIEIPITGATATEKDKDECAKVELGPLPPDALPIADLPKGADTEYLYYSACRDATVTLTIKYSSPEKTQLVRVADPNFVQMVKLPYKGTVTMHSECGVSVGTQAQAESNTSAVVGALATQGKAIKDALDAAKK